VGKNGPKLTPGNAGERGDCKRSFDRGAFLLTCVNTTMSEFADQMRRFAPGYIDLPVADLTGLKDAFNFTMAWNDRGVTDPGKGKVEDSSGALVAPGGGVTFFTGVEKIGLKMTKEKRPMPVVVVDRIDREPAEN
jgi:uncharacterized protein (TIGR03435 family)